MRHSPATSAPVSAKLSRHPRLSKGRLWVPGTLSTSCEQAVFVDHAADASVTPHVVSLTIDRFG